MTLHFKNWTYNLDDKIGEGGCSNVYICYHENKKIKEKFAIKIFNNSKNQNMYEREAHIMELLTEVDGVPSLIDQGINNEGKPCFVMSYINGKTLDDHISDNGCFSLDDSLKVAEKVLSIIQQSHQKGIIHLDIKLSNIMIDWPNIYLIDWGVSELIYNRITEYIRANYSYSAPEIFHGKFSAASDFYSLAWIIVYCLSEQRPYSLDSGFITKNKDQYRTICHALERPNLPKDIPEALKPLIYQWLNKNPEKRKINYDLFEALSTATGKEADFLQYAAIDSFSAENNYLKFGAERGIPYCQLAYAESLNSKDPERINWIKAAHQQRYSPATRMLAEHYVETEGRGKASDQTLALLWEAAKQQDTRAIYLLANEYWLTNNNLKFIEVLPYLRFAAKSGARDAQYLFAKYLSTSDESSDEALYYYQASAKRGYSRARRALE